MSRCFPYPPPGYLLPKRGDTKGSLIESIKLQKDKEKAKEERRKERKREKKDKKRKRESPLEKDKSALDDGFCQTKIIYEKSQFLEKEKEIHARSHGDDESSDVTEEHDQPVCEPKPSYSSENSQNSDKRRRHEPPNSIKADGSILKIRLSSFKKKEPTVIDDVGPSTSGRTDLIPQNDFEFGKKLVTELPPSTSFKTKINVPVTVPIEKQPSLKLTDSQLSTQDIAVKKSSTSKASKAELLYKSLLESWAPPIQGTEEEDQDWLFHKKTQKNGKSETISNGPCSLDSNLWPRAQFLPSVDLYALPYTVPF